MSEQVVGTGRREGVEENVRKDPALTVHVEEWVPVVLLSRELGAQISVLLGYFVVVYVEEGRCQH